MSDYRRLISYIYAYEGGIKGKNVGYTRLETRGEQCRIYVNVKKIYVGANDMGVYLLTPDKEIWLGCIFMRGGSGEFRTNVAVDNVEDSGYSLKECYGLTVHDVVEGAWQCCTTIWEDAVAHTAELDLEQMTADAIKKQREEKTEEQDVFTGLPISEEIESELIQEEKKQEEQPPWYGEETMLDTAIGKETVEKKEDEESEKPDPERTAGIPLLLGDEEKLAELDALEDEKKKNHEKVWNQMQSRCARLRAFNYEYGCEILAIKPQDIGLLPREMWIYGNNSFLLHGYYNYRHLILAKLGTMENLDEPRYLLGVPGHYFHNEKNMAAMFGFPGFVLSLHQPEEDGRFGYWYTDIHL